MIARRCAYSSLALALGLMTFGCSRSKDDLPREPVAGTVTMDGQPLPEAVIQFYPTGDAKTTGANAQIKDGQFSIPREDGLVPGTYKVSISHAELQAALFKGKKSDSPRSKRLGPELIPARYNSKSELTAEIKPGGTEDLKFELTSKK
jgi:hypothetical protein